MKPKKAIKVLRKQLKSDPGNLAVRIRLAGLLREIGSYDEAIEIYLGVLRHYQATRKLSQAAAVCAGILEFAPQRADIQRLRVQLEEEQMRAQARPDIRAAPSTSPPPVQRAMPVLPSLGSSAPEGAGTSHSRLGGRSEVTLNTPAPPRSEGDSRSTRPPPVDDGERRSRRKAASSLPSFSSIDYSEPRVPSSPTLAPAPTRAEDVDEDEPTRIAGDAGLGGVLALGGSRSGTGDVTIRGKIPSGPLSMPARAPQPPLLRAPSILDEDVEEATIVDPGLSFDEMITGPLPFGGAEDLGAVDTGKLAPFAALPQSALIELSRHVRTVEVNANEIILREGEFGDSCYVIVSGTVRILKRDPFEQGADLHEVARLSDGDLFGEFALLGDQRRHATVQSITRCRMYEVPRKVIRDLGSRYPEIRPVLERFYRERMLETLMATATFFRPLGAEQQQDVVRLFTHERYPAGHPIIHEGARSGGFYLILLGSVEIQKRFDGQRVVSLATLSEGSYFGELSLLRGDVARATVVATGPVEVARLEAKRFYTLVASNPMLWAQVWAEANRRELETLRIIAGVTGSV